MFPSLHSLSHAFLFWVSECRSDGRLRCKSSESSFDDKSSRRRDRDCCRSMRQACLVIFPRSVLVCVCVRVYVCVYVCVCVRVRVYVCVCVCLYDFVVLQVGEGSLFGRATNLTSFLNSRSNTGCFPGRERSGQDGRRIQGDIQTTTAAGAVLRTCPTTSKHSDNSLLSPYPQ